MLDDIFLLMFLSHRKFCLFLFETFEVFLLDPGMPGLQSMGLSVEQTLFVSESRCLLTLIGPSKAMWQCN